MVWLQELHCCALFWDIACQNSLHPKSCLLCSTQRAPASLCAQLGGAIVTWPSVVLVLLFRMLLLHLVRRCQAPPLHEKASSRCSQKSVLLVALFDVHV